MAEIKDKIVTVESLAAVHNYNIGAYAPYEIVSEVIHIDSIGKTEIELRRVFASMPNNSIKFITLNHSTMDALHSGGVWHATVHRTNNDYGIIIATTYNYGSTCQLIIDDGNWQSWECINPPMAVNTEYRTTERWMGKTVYTQLLSLGTLSEGLNIRDLSLNATNLIRNEAVMIDELGHGETLPVVYENNFTDGVYTAYVASCGAGRIQIYVNSGMVGRQTYITLWYTKD